MIGTPAADLARAGRTPRTMPHLRWWIGGLLFLSTAINYLDRQTLSVLVPFLKEGYHWNNEDFALVVISFRAAYAIGQGVSGRLLDRMGTRNGLTLTVVWRQTLPGVGGTSRTVRFFSNPPASCFACFFCWDLDKTVSSPYNN
jgi:sugar phosphate permease